MLVVVLRKLVHSCERVHLFSWCTRPVKLVLGRTPITKQKQTLDCSFRGYEERVVANTLVLYRPLFEGGR